MIFNVTFRQKDKGWQFIISAKINNKWKQLKSKQGFKSKKEAKLYSENVLEELKLNSVNDVPEHLYGLTIGELKKDYLNHIQLHREYNTYCNYKQSLAFFDIDNIEVSKLKVSDVQKCLDKLIGSRSKSTIDRRITIFKCMLNYCNRQYNIHIPNLSNLTLPSAKDPKTKKALEPYIQDELINRYKSRSKDYYIVVLLALTCGLRVGEICGLTWADIDFENSNLNINKQWKINKVTKVYGFGELKSKESYRTVPIPSKTLEELKKLKIERFKNAIDITYQQERIIICESTKSMSVNLDRQLQRKYQVCVHELRHTYATNLIANGIDFKTAAKLLGHNVEQTMRTYSHVTQKMLDDAAILINKIF